MEGELLASLMIISSTFIVDPALIQRKAVVAISIRFFLMINIHLTMKAMIDIRTQIAQSFRVQERK